MVILNKIIFLTLIGFAFSAVASSSAETATKKLLDLNADPVNIGDPIPNQYTDPVDKTLFVDPTPTDRKVAFICPHLQYLLSLSDTDLFTQGLNSNVGKCYVSNHIGIGGYCDYYLAISGTPTQGLPDLIGTGCLYAPSLPKHINICWGPPNTYQTYIGTTTPICTNNYLTNGANMLRIGINKGRCGNLCTCPRKYTLLMMSDSDLVIEAYNNRVGKCVIKRGCNSACDYYAQVTGLPAGVANGLPDLIGTGCIVFPPFMTTCWGSPNTYPNYSGTSTPICTNDWIKNAANMIRIGLKKNRCGVC